MRRYVPLLLLLAVCVVAVYLGALVVRKEGRGILTIAFLDVGQGDAIYIESPTGAQVLLDGGPDGRVVQALQKHMSLLDRSLDALIISNPDQDHIAGFLEVLERYEVSMLIEPGVDKETDTYRTLKQKAQEQGVRTVLARRGMEFSLGGGAVLRVLFPDRDVRALEPNTGSLVLELRHGENEALLMGDSVSSIESFLVSLEKKGMQSDILKVGHHGSKTSTSELLLAAVRPSYAVISSGRDNRYGHPHTEVLARLADAGVRVLRTDKEGTVVFESDGLELRRR